MSVEPQMNADGRRWTQMPNEFHTAQAGLENFICVHRCSSAVSKINRPLWDSASVNGQKLTFMP